MVCRKQEILWKENDSGLALGQPEDLPQKWRHSGQFDQSAQRALWKRSRSENPSRKGARIPGDEARLPQAKQGKDLHDIIPEKNPG